MQNIYRCKILATKILPIKCWIFLFQQFYCSTFCSFISLKISKFTHISGIYIDLRAVFCKNQAFLTDPDSDHLRFCPFSQIVFII